jgi:chemotaxis protein methyltransferase CheR
MSGIRPDEQAAWTRLVRELCGIDLDASKGYLLETRLAELRRDTRSADYLDLHQKVRADPTLQRRAVDAITTKETSFFRDGAPFELLRHKLFPELIDRRRRAGLKNLPMRIWSAACSTGQEVYSVGIVLKELLGDLRDYDIRLLATDISEQAVTRASRGVFSELEIGRGMPPERMSMYFERHAEGWKIRDEIRALVQFERVNLLRPYSFPAPFDLVLCRNVAIYFSEADRIALFRSIGRCLAPQGSLVIGSTESLTGLCPEFEPQRHMRTVFYQLRAPATAARGG